LTAQIKTVETELQARASLVKEIMVVTQPTTAMVPVAVAVALEAQD
jgi:hypothetical protein